MQNPIKTAVQSRVSGALGGTFFGLGVLGPIGQAMMAVSITVGFCMYTIHEYQVIVISNQEMAAARFDAQSVLAANRLTPEQAAANLAAGVVINGLDGLPIIGKSLETFTTYLTAQAKAAAEMAGASAARFDAQSILAASHLTSQQAAANLAAGVVINGLDGKPIIGKSLEALTTYLATQAKAMAATAENTIDYETISKNNVERWNKCSVCSGKVTSPISIYGMRDVLINSIGTNFHLVDEDGITPLTGIRAKLVAEYVTKATVPQKGP